MLSPSCKCAQGTNHVTCHKCTPMYCSEKCSKSLREPMRYQVFKKVLDKEQCLREFSMVFLIKISPGSAFFLKNVSKLRNCRNDFIDVKCVLNPLKVQLIALITLRKTIISQLNQPQMENEKLMILGWLQLVIKPEPSVTQENIQQVESPMDDDKNQQDYNNGTVDTD